MERVLGISNEPALSIDGRSEGGIWIVAAMICLCQPGMACMISGQAHLLKLSACDGTTNWACYERMSDVDVESADAGDWGTSPDAMLLLKRSVTVRSKLVEARGKQEQNMREIRRPRLMQSVTPQRQEQTMERRYESKGAGRCLPACLPAAMMIYR